MKTCDSWTLSSSCPSHLINWRVSNLRINSFIWRVNSIHTKQTPSQIDLLKRKGVYPCSYMDSFDKFAEEKLPPKELWKNTLAGGEVTISDQDLQHASLEYSIAKH